MPIRRLSSRNLKLRDGGSCTEVTVPVLIDNSKFPASQGEKVKPFCTKIEDPETGEDKWALVYIPE